MSLNRILRASICWGAVLGVAACGGGGGGSSGTPTSPTTPPASGTYAWLLKAQGPTAALKFGLSLVHPAATGTEYVIELASSVVSSAKTVVSGTVDASGLKVDSLKPYALLYIVGGDVRRVPLEANGAAPISRVQRARSLDACDFVIDANDYATPDNSRYIVSTAGPDGTCGTADDGRAEVRLDATLGLTYTKISGALPLGTFRDVATLAPRGWIYPTTVNFWGPSAGTTVTTRTGAEPALTSVIASTYRSALVDDGTQLSVLDFPAGIAPTEARLSTLTTGGGGWASIGFDATDHYVYRNGGTTAAPRWTVLKISRAAPSATVLANGTGQLLSASLGRTLIYGTEKGSAVNRLLGIPKAISAPVTTLETTITGGTTVLTSANDVHLFLRATNAGPTIDMIDEAGTRLYSTTAGGALLVLADAGSENFNSSESRTRFVFADGFSSSRAFGDATMVGYDTTAKTATTYGLLPGSADFGTDFVLASAMGGPASFMTGFAARSSNGVIQDAGTKVFSFDASTANSLKFTTSAQ